MESGSDDDGKDNDYQVEVVDLEDDGSDDDDGNSIWSDPCHREAVRFTCVINFMRFRSVCSLWRSIIDYLPDVIIARIPWLLIPYPSSSVDENNLEIYDNNSIDFFCLAESSPSPPDSFPSCLANNTNHRLHLPELNNTVFHGLNISSWLLVLCRGCNSSPFLFNPFTRKQVSLPPLPLPTTFHHCKYGYGEHYIHQHLLNDTTNFVLGPNFYIPTVSLAVLSSDPCTSSLPNIQVMVIHGWDSRLAFCRPGDAEWTTVSYGDSGQPCRKFSALAYCNTRFYAIDINDNLVVCDANACPAIAIVVTHLPKRSKDFSRCHLVNSGHELLLVIRSWQRSNFNNFCVYKLIKEEITRAEGQKEEEEEEEEEEKKEQEKEKNAVEESVEQEDQNDDEEEEGLWFRRMHIMDEEREVQKVEEEEEENGGKWVRMHSIGKRALFICQENTLAISTDGLDRCNPNSIYYYDVFGEEHYPYESSVKLIEFSLTECKMKKMIHCSSLHSFQLWQPLFLQSSLTLE